MTFDDFENKLRDVKDDFLKAYGRDMTTLKELEDYLVRRKLSKKRGSKALKSLKGLNL